LPLIILIDEPIERRKGKEIKAKGCYRDAVRSSKAKVVHCYGLKWISMQLLIPVPWANRMWALPFLTVLAPSKAADAATKKRHKTTVGWACQMIKAVRRWVPYRAIVLVGDGAYAAVVLALCCAGLSIPVTLVSRVRLDAALYDFPPSEQPGKRGRKPKKGKRLRSLKERVNDPATVWTSFEVVWYGNQKRTVEAATGICLWYTPGSDPVPIKWVMVRDPKGQLRTEAMLCTCLESSALEILTWFISRWNIEVTFEDLRAHFGFETQRQWSEKAIARKTPSLFATFSLVVVMALKIMKDATMPILTAAWYQKTEATFSDVIALVRRHIWCSRYLVNSSRRHDSSQLRDEFLQSILDQVCHST
ncbi:MAG: transposase, partial [Deltaproteobacteria bacterium]|nr:transposase [Deltaproteobacteria bacterium]